MSGVYLNHEDRSKVLMVIAFLAVLEEIEERPKLVEVFGKAFSDLKRGKAFIRRALESLSENLGEEQSRKVYNMARTHDVAVVGRAAPKGKSEFIVEVDKLYDIAELAIDNHCTGCTKTEHGSCRVYQVLAGADIPPADTKVTNDCPYRQ